MNLARPGTTLPRPAPLCWWSKCRVPQPPCRVGKGTTRGRSKERRRLERGTRLHAGVPLIRRPERGMYLTSRHDDGIYNDTAGFQHHRYLGCPWQLVVDSLSNGAVLVVRMPSRLSACEISRQRMCVVRTSVVRIWHSKADTSHVLPSARKAKKDFHFEASFMPFERQERTERPRGSHRVLPTLSQPVHEVFQTHPPMVLGEGGEQRGWRGGGGLEGRVLNLRLCPHPLSCISLRPLWAGACSPIRSPMPFPAFLCCSSIRR